MPWAAAGAVATAGIGYAGSQKAAGAQEKAAGAGGKLQREMYNSNKELLQPYIGAGNDAEAALLAYMGLGRGGGTDPNAPGARKFSLADFEADPGYQFRLQQGQDALTNQRAALGGAFSGATLKDLTRYSQGMASDEFNNAYNRYVNDQTRRYNQLAGITGTGLSAASALAGVGQGAANQMSALALEGGNASAAGTVGGINAINQGLGNAYNAYQQQQIFGNSYQTPGGVALNDVPNYNWNSPNYTGNNYGWQYQEAG